MNVKKNLSTIKCTVESLYNDTFYSDNSRYSDILNSPFCFILKFFVLLRHFAITTFLYNGIPKLIRVILYCDNSTVESLYNDITESITTFSTVPSVLHMQTFFVLLRHFAITTVPCDVAIKGFDCMYTRVEKNDRFSWTKLFWFLLGPQTTLNLPEVDWFCLRLAHCISNLYGNLYGKSHFFAFTFVESSKII